MTQKKSSSPLSPEVLSKLSQTSKEIDVSKTLDELKDRVEYFRAKSDKAESVLESLRRERGEYRELIAELVNSVIAIQPYKSLKYDSGSNKRSAISPVVKLSDWQTGEVVKADETEGFGEFNWEIQQRRIAQLESKLIDWINMHREGGFPINEAHIFSEGDIVSGNIHYELEVTNDVPVTEATARAGFLLADFASKISSHVDKLYLWEMTMDNHGRLTRKLQFKQGAINNYGYLAHVIANTALAKHKNIEIVQSRGGTLLAEVQTKKFLIKHGHSVKTWMGIPFYGLQREQGREATRRMNSEKKFDYISIGHYHVPSYLPGLLINGSLPGTTELDHQLGRFAPPSQVSFMVHPRYGLFNWMPWILN